MPCAFTKAVGLPRARRRCLPGLTPFDISGENGRSAYLVRSGQDVSLVDGTCPKPDVTIAAAASDWLSLLNGKASPESLFLEGKITITDNLELILQLASVIRLSSPSAYQADKWRLEIDYLNAFSL